MLELISSSGLSSLQWALLLLSAGLIGANKAGLVSISLISIPVTASIFGGRASTGFILPILIIADIVAAVSYRRNIRWRELMGLLPWTLCGITFGLLVGGSVPDRIFKILIAVSIFIVLIFMLYKQISGHEFKVKSKWYNNAVIGLLGGFASMIGNAAGPIIATYFISLDLGKDEFVSTRAWFFWLLNVLKLPLHIFVWKTISFEILKFDLIMIPAIALGGFAGLKLVKLFPEKPYRIFVISATFVSSIFLII